MKQKAFKYSSFGYGAPLPTKTQNQYQENRHLENMHNVFVRRTSSDVSISSTGQPVPLENT